MTETPRPTFNPMDKITALSGKAYLEVKWRLVWLRLEHPTASINTEMIKHDEKEAIFKATIVIPNRDQDAGWTGGDATGWGSETKTDFKDYLEKAETKAIGRALAALGYGTQFAPEFESNDPVVDSPVDLTPAAPTNVNQNAIASLMIQAEKAGITEAQIIAWRNDKGYKSRKDMPIQLIKALTSDLRNNARVQAFKEKYPEQRPPIDVSTLTPA